MKKICMVVLVACAVAACSGPKEKAAPPAVSRPAAEQPKNEAVSTAKAAKEERAGKPERSGKREAFRRQVEAILAVSVLEMRVEKSGVSSGQVFDQLVIKLGFRNSGPKDITIVSGQLRFFDLADREVGSFPFSYDDGVGAGRSATWIYTRHDKEFMRSNKALTRLEEDKYRTQFEPELIVYADGTKLAAKE